MWWFDDQFLGSGPGLMTECCEAGQLLWTIPLTWVEGGPVPGAGNLGAWSLLVERFGFDCHSKVRTGGWTWKPGLLAECCKERYLLETFQLDGSPWIGSELVVEPEQCSGKTLAFWTGSQSEKMRSLFPVVHNLYVKLESSRHKSSSRPEPEEAPAPDAGNWDLPVGWIVVDRVKARAV